ncbi:MAG: helix-turn-helix domain-containing protein [Hyalangium sp.]|uniref:helix-turn-helix domain-containing protein n=1 Tax=Hyalangium sp. TaxID=2028555 RepID=UPI0038998B87
MIGTRLRQARTAAGLTLDEVSVRLGANGHPLTKAALSKYETGKSLPRPSTLLMLARTLGVRADFFVREPTAQVEWRAFRKHASLTRSLQQKVQASVAQIVEGHVWLEETLNSRQRHRFPSPRKVATPEDAEAAADAMRKHWKLSDGPLESVTQTIEDNGCIAVCSSDVPPSFDGLSGWANGEFPVLVSSARPSIDRRRYNFAHELGHLAMNCSGLSETEEENLAHRFAAAFLVPASVAKREFGEKRRNISMEELMLLKQKYGLSMQSWAHRAHELGIIDAPTHNRLFAQFSAKGWREREPVEFTGREEPVRLKLLVLRALAEGVITPSRAEELCPGCTSEAPAMDNTTPRLSVRALRKLPPEMREETLLQGALVAEPDYKNDAELTSFEAFGEHDLHV